MMLDSEFFPLLKTYSRLSIINPHITASLLLLLKREEKKIQTFGCINSNIFIKNDYFSIYVKEHD